MRAKLFVGFRDLGVFNGPGKNCSTIFIEADIRWDWVGNVRGKEIEGGCLDSSLNKGFERRVVPEGCNKRLRRYAEGGF